MGSKRLFFGASRNYMGCTLTPFEEDYAPRVPFSDQQMNLTNSFHSKTRASFPTNSWPDHPPLATNLGIIKYFSFLIHMDPYSTRVVIQNSWLLPPSGVGQTSEAPLRDWSFIRPARPYGRRDLGGLELWGLRALVPVIRYIQFLRLSDYLCLRCLQSCNNQQVS